MEIMMDAPLKVLLVEDDWAARSAVLEYLAGHDMEMAGADSLEASLQAVEKFTPDIAVLDIVLPEKSDQRADFQKHVGVEIARLLRQRFPRIGIVFLSAFVDRGPEVVQMFMDGHDRITYLLKGSKPQELLNAIQRLGSGSIGLDIAPGVQSRRNTALDLARELLSAPEREVLSQALDGLPDLSEPERKVFEAIGCCLTRQQAALELNLSPKTISSHMESIYDKLNLRSIPAGLTPHSLLAKLHLLHTLQVAQEKEDSK
jgi:DNA-binding NarL/FixJ family response regulator